ncbi:MAG TPA: acetate--CoA ligase family protein [Methylocella sp.]|nr:acetate--CoA ligase family protein [Methylocella sp.]
MTSWQEALFTPRRVAVIGASASQGKAGALFLCNLISAEAGFGGEVIAIHPTANEILGCPVYPSVSAVPEPVDLALVVTPPAAVPGVVADCGAAQVSVAIIISGGFAETGPRGAELQREVARTAAATGVRIVGPNCFGVINTASGLNCSLSIGLPSRGGVSLITQSGAYGMAAFSRSIDDGLGFAKIVALGNKIDLGEADLLAFLGEDPATKVVAILLESVTGGRRFFEIAADVAARKPLVVLKTGRHPGAQRAAVSHTAALSSDEAVLSAALRQAGAHVVDDGKTLLDVASALDRQPPLRGSRVGIITNSGGTGVELTDLFEERGLVVPALSPELHATIASVLPPHGSGLNPIDVTTQWEHFATMYARSTEALMDSEEVDAVVPVLLQRSALMPEVTDALIAAVKQARKRGSLKPIHVCWVAPRAADPNRERLRAAGIPCHEWPITTAAVLAATMSKPSRPFAQPSKRKPVAAPGCVDEVGWVPSDAALCLLQQAGFPVARWALAADSGQAAAAARDLGFPVALKAERPGLVHKSEADAVRLHLLDDVAVAAAFEDFCRRLGPGPALVQQQAALGIELVVGARRDANFGPVVIAGLGGVWIEALEDRALRLAPVAAEEALTMLGELKGKKILSGFRSQAEVDAARFAKLIADVSQWFDGARWLGELDLNPIIANGDDFKIVDVRMRVADRLISS